jgi:uncharacterized membrane protein
MNSLPLHPALVHFPLGLAMLMPVLAAGFGWAIWTGRIGARAWLAIVALQGVLVGSALVAINTGGNEEERVEAVVPEGVLHQHEEFAEQFAWASGAACVLSALVLFGRRSAVSHGLTAAAVAATVVVAALGIRVGHAGGQLVYSHNAASAYALAATNPAEGSPTLNREGDRDDDDARPAEGRRR